MANLKLSRFAYRDLILVRWQDASGAGCGWSDLDEIPSSPITIDQPCVYVGHNKEVLQIAQGIPIGDEGDNEVLAPSLIPLGCILSVKKIKGGT